MVAAAAGVFAPLPQLIDLLGVHLPAGVQDPGDPGVDGVSKNGLGLYRPLRWLGVGADGGGCPWCSCPCPLSRFEMLPLTAVGATTGRVPRMSLPKLTHSIDVFCAPK